jgi:hypothetical protein
MKRLTVPCVGILGPLLVAPYTGCAGSNTHGEGFGSGHGDSGVSRAPSSGGAAGTASGTAGTSSSGASSSPASGDEGGACTIAGDGDAGACLDNVAGFTGVPYVAAVAHQGVCTYSDISAFMTACVTGLDQAACDDWVNGNLASDAGPGTACGNCILPQTNDGPIWFDPNGYPSPNYAACIQTTDTANGMACATALNNSASCEGIACDACMTQSDSDCCIKTVDSAGCATFTSALKSACMADFASGGALETCSPGGATNSLAEDYSYIISVICGSADGG